METLDQDSAVRLSSDVKVSPLLGRRLAAAGLDVTIVSLCCFACFLALSPLVENRQPWLWPPAIGLLGLYALAEMFTGRTPGRLWQGLTIRRADGAPASIAALAVRGLVKLLPPLLFIASLLVTDQLTFLALASLSIFLLLCYMPPCYLLLLRTGRTMFDAVAGTALARA